jgi:hypothetical protein
MLEVVVIDRRKLGWKWRVYRNGFVLAEGREKTRSEAV